MGLPVVTSITDGTPQLNEKQQCVLLSKGGDHVAMAKNMVLVLEDSVLARNLVQNSYLRLQEVYNNESEISSWVDGYKKLSDCKL